MIENSNFQVGLKRAADDGNAVTLMKVNGLMRTAGKLFLQVMAVGAGPLSNRKNIFVFNKVGFCQFQVAPQRFSSLSCKKKGTKAFFIFGGNYYETMVYFKIIFAL